MTTCIDPDELGTEEDWEVVGTHPCDFSTCFWNNQRKPASLGMCQLVTMRADMYTAIAMHTAKAKTDAANCPRAAETELLPPRIRVAGAPQLVQDLPLYETQQGLAPVADTVNQQYRPWRGWRPSK
jgi:hypothetical protein